ncbi:nucleotide cyclase [Zopfochytrium polystomum]|nr:nucleotide cyclase [Zopfochytrium polystomum]
MANRCFLIDQRVRASGLHNHAWNDHCLCETRSLQRIRTVTKRLQHIFCNSLAGQSFRSIPRRDTRGDNHATDPILHCCSSTDAATCSAEVDCSVVNLLLCQQQFCCSDLGEISRVPRFARVRHTAAACLLRTPYGRPFLQRENHLFHSNMYPFCYCTESRRCQLLDHTSDIGNLRGALGGSSLFEECLRRLDYQTDLILLIQSELVEEESLKSNRLLRTVLPERLIKKLLKDPESVFYEQFDLVTVLHMDIVGFTALSSSVEPTNVFLMINSLFAYFDRLTEEFLVEKVTTIGDAYVACSNLSSLTDPDGAAISVCTVALLMQSFVNDTFNFSPIIRDVVKQNCLMRIGVHTGPCHGAIMGGLTNFRYDLMGEAVTIAEKIQEHCEPGHVFISGATKEFIVRSGRFQLLETDFCAVKQEIFRLVGFNRGG